MGEQVAELRGAHPDSGAEVVGEHDALLGRRGVIDEQLRALGAGLAEGGERLGGGLRDRLWAPGAVRRAAVAFSAAAEGASHAVVCTVGNSGLLAAAQLRCGELRSGLSTASRVVGLARGLRSVSVRDELAPLQESAAARRESACQDLARELAMLRRAA